MKKKRKGGKRPRYTLMEIAIIAVNAADMFANLQWSFEKSMLDIKKHCGVDRTVDGISLKWYKDISKVGIVFVMNGGNAEMIANTKILHRPGTSPNDVERILRYMSPEDIKKLQEYLWLTYTKCLPAGFNRKVGNDNGIYSIAGCEVDARDIRKKGNKKRVNY